MQRTIIEFIHLSKNSHGERSRTIAVVLRLRQDDRFYIERLILKTVKKHYKHLTCISSNINGAIKILRCALPDTN